LFGNSGGTWGTREIVVLQSYLVWEHCLGILGTYIGNIGETAAALSNEKEFFFSGPSLFWEL
jgi:hypothetical protein